MKNKTSNQRIIAFLAIVIIVLSLVFDVSSFAPEIKEEKQNVNEISGDVTGIEKITGFQTKQLVLTEQEKKAFANIYRKYPQIPRGTFEGLYCAESSCGNNVNHQRREIGPLGISPERVQQYGENGKYDPTTLEGSLYIAAKHIDNDIMSKVDKSASQDVQANQISVAWNRGKDKTPSSDDVKKVLNTPDYKNAYEVIYADAANMNREGAVGRFVNFMYGFTSVARAEAQPASSPAATAPLPPPSISQGAYTGFYGDKKYGLSSDLKFDWRRDPTNSNGGDWWAQACTFSCVYEGKDTSWFKVDDNKNNLPGWDWLSYTQLQREVIKQMAGKNYEDGLTTLAGISEYVKKDPKNNNIKFTFGKENFGDYKKIAAMQNAGKTSLISEASAPIQPSTITLPPDTKLKDLKLGDIVDGKKITNIEYEEGKIYIYVDNKNNLKDAIASFADPENTISGSSTPRTITRILTQEGTSPVPNTPTTTGVKFKNVDSFVGYALQGETYYVDDKGQVFFVGKDGKPSGKAEGSFTKADDIQNYKNRYIEVKSKKESNGGVSYEISITPSKDIQLIDSDNRQFEIREGKIYSKSPISSTWVGENIVGNYFDTEVKNENGKLVIDYGAGSKTPLTQQQIKDLQEKAPIATSKLLMNPYFVQSDGTVYVANVGDKFTRQENGEFITYTYTGTEKGKAILKTDNGKEATFNEPNQLDLTQPSNGFNAVRKNDGRSSISSVAYDDRIDVPPEFKQLQRKPPQPKPEKPIKPASSESYEVKQTSKTTYTVDYVFEKDRSATVADVVGKTFGTRIDETSAKIISDSYDFKLNDKPIVLAKDPSTGRYQFYYTEDLDNGNPKPNSQRVIMKEDNQIIIIEKQGTSQVVTTTSPDQTNVDYDFGPLPPGVVTTFPDKINGKEYKAYTIGDKLIWTVDGNIATPEDMEAFNKYYSVFGPPKVSGFIKDEKIGKETYKVTYDSTNNPTKICKEGTEDCISITADALNSIKQNIKGDVKLTWDNEGTISFTTEGTKSESGKQGTPSYSKSTEVTLYEYFKNGVLITTKTDKVENKDGIISLRKTEQIIEEDTLQAYSVTEYTKKAGETAINEESSDYKKIIYDPETRRPIGLEEKENEEIKRAGIDPYTGMPFEDQNPATQSKLSTLNNQYTVASFIASIEKALTEFQGLGYLASLFMDQDALLAWRDRVDRIFATFYLGTEYITSSICSQYLDGEEEGIAYAETPQGLAQIAAHIEATKTEPINVDGETQFIYKITFSVRNGDYEKDLRAPEEMKVNVVLKGQKTVNVFKKEQVVKRGSTLSRAGRNAIVQESPASFDKICLTFDQVPLRWKISDKEICNKIQASSGEPTFISTPASGTGGNAQTSDDINDF